MTVTEKLLKTENENDLKIENDFDYINAFLKENSIVVPENYLPIFENHLHALIDRIRNDECVVIDESETDNIDAEINEDDAQLAHTILSGLFSKYGIEESVSEEKLLAIYLTLLRNLGGEM